MEQFQGEDISRTVDLQVYFQSTLNFHISQFENINLSFHIFYSSMETFIVFGFKI